MFILQNATIYLAAGRDELDAAQASGLKTAVLGYTISSGRLNRSAVYPGARGELMIVSDLGFSGGGNPALLAGDIHKECLAHGYGGAAADFESQSPFLTSALAALLPLLQRSGMRLFVSEGFSTEGAVTIVKSSISGGSLEERLKELREKYGAENLALDVERVAMDFTLPQERGEGRRLPFSEPEALLAGTRAESFFSSSLCENYFTFIDKEKQTHFVLFDNAASIKRKLELAKALGIRIFFILYPEVRDILDRIAE